MVRRGRAVESAGPAFGGGAVRWVRPHVPAAGLRTGTPSSGRGGAPSAAPDASNGGAEAGREASQRSRHLETWSVASDEGHCRKAENNVDPKALPFRDWSWAGA